jgi:hypothetical protein
MGAPLETAGRVEGATVNPVPRWERADGESNASANAVRVIGISEWAVRILCLHFRYRRKPEHSQVIAYRGRTLEWGGVGIESF